MSGTVHFLLCTESRKHVVLARPLQRLAQLTEHILEAVDARFSVAGSVVAVVGTPNVGKSSLINGLRAAASPATPPDSTAPLRTPAAGGLVVPAGPRASRSKPRAAVVGARPGVTRHVRSIQLCAEPNVFLLDTPGVLRPRLGDLSVALALAAAGCIKDADRLVQSASLAEFLLASLPCILEPAAVVPALRSLGIDTGDPRIAPLLRAGGRRGLAGALGEGSPTRDGPAGALGERAEMAMAVAVQAALSQVAERVGSRDAGGGFSERAAALHVLQCFRSGRLGKCCFDP